MPNSKPKQIKAKVPPGVSAELKAYLINLLKGESGSALVPQLVTKFPKNTGPRFKVILEFEEVDAPAKPSSNK